MHLTLITLHYAKDTTVRMTVRILQQEKLRGRRERDRQRRADEIAEQREERLTRRRETDRASYVLPRRDTHGSRQS